MHAASAELAFEQLVLLVKQSRAGQELPRDDIKKLLYLLVDVVIQFGVERHQRFIKEIWYEPHRKRRRLGAPKPRWLVIAGKAMAIAAVALVASQYLAGFLFLAWSGRMCEARGRITIARYAYYYGGIPEVRRRLWVSSAGGLALIAFGALPAHSPAQALPARGRPLGHSSGDRARRALCPSWTLFRAFRPPLFDPGWSAGRAVCRAPPRAEKGTAIVIPNLLFWQGRCCVWTSSLRIGHSRRGTASAPVKAAIRFIPRGGWQYGLLNPLGYVSSRSELRISDVQRIGAILYPEVRAGSLLARGRALLLFGRHMYVLETPSLPPP